MNDESQTDTTMKTFLRIIFAAVLLPTVVNAQSYSINWYKVSGGGGTSSGGNYTVSSTSGQQDAGGPMQGGPYSLTGGFWALIAVQTPGAPYLTIQLIAPGTALISWPAPSTGFVLQQIADLTKTNWSSVTNSVTSTNGFNQVTVSPLPGNKYYRLENP